MNVTLPDGTVLSGVPDDITKADLTAKLAANGYDVAKLSPVQTTAAQPASANPLIGADAKKALNYSGSDITGGLLRGAGSIGATIMRALPNVLGGDTAQESEARRANLDPSIAQFTGADPNSLAYKTGKLGAEIAGTAGVGSMLAAPLKMLGSTPAIDAAIQALQSGGFRAGDLGWSVPGALTRIGAGAGVGGLSTGMIDPNAAKTGALIGGALPTVAAALGTAGNAIRNASLGNPLPPEVTNLAQRAQELGINIPADRLVNSRPLNALAASLNYVPFSGRAATEDSMNSQLNKALSNTFGQDSSNVTMALRQAKPKLGAEFDRVLQSNTVKVDPQFLQDLADSANRATNELGSDGASVINKQVNEIINKASTGEIDGQAAYNIKKTLDRIGQRSTPEAYYANDLKKSLMGALNRSLGPDEAAAFATTRQQYGNMLDLQNLAKNGAEGEVSVARLANMKDINNQGMQELADIAAQFVKPREGMHGAAQRATVGGLTAYFAGLPGLAAGAAIGRGANTVLNSSAAKNFVLKPSQNLLSSSPELGLIAQGAYRTLPLAPALLSGE